VGEPDGMGDQKLNEWVNMEYYLEVSTVLTDADSAQSITSNLSKEESCEENDKHEWIPVRKWQTYKALILRRMMEQGGTYNWLGLQAFIQYWKYSQ
jgi:hypothetical protein